MIKITEADNIIVSNVAKNSLSMEIARRCAPRKKNPPDRNRGEQLKTQAVNRLVEVIQQD
jgi:hypothetical protein